MLSSHFLIVASLILSTLCCLVLTLGWLKVLVSLYSLPELEVCFFAEFFNLEWKTEGVRVGDGSDTKAVSEEALLWQVTV